ncbi:MAG TPA: DUF1003 domain-containing protein [Acidobacteriota bacterium]|nr:DUF1003 domain-containing protein [Acidobacteriota bacterium]
MPRKRELAFELLQADYDQLSEHEQGVIKRIVDGRSISRDINEDIEERLTFGQRLADRVTELGGSWTFIIAFFIVLCTWVAINTILLAGAAVFDPYPFILLNLVLSMLAAVQAPVIMMSQNRQSARDRLDAHHDYEVNLKAELEIRHLHIKLDELLQQHNSMIEKLERIARTKQRGGQPDEVSPD